MAWLVLVLAGLLEVVWATALDRSAGFTRPVPVVVLLLGLAGSMGLLGLALRELPLGTAYAVWVGIGATGTALVGMAWLGEPVSPARLGFVAMIVAGVIGLRLTAGSARGGDDRGEAGGVEARPADERPVDVGTGE